MQLTSDLFQANAPIPAAYTCKGRNVSPSLRINGVPAETVSLAIIMHDPDAPSGDFLHWTIWNIDPLVTGLEEGSVPADSRQGLNGFGTVGYGGPCPPSGTHRYIFELYALDTLLDLPDGANRATLEAALSSHTLATATLMGTFSA